MIGGGDFSVYNDRGSWYLAGININRYIGFNLLNSPSRNKFQYSDHSNYFISCFICQLCIGSTYHLSDCVSRYIKIPEAYPQLMEASKSERLNALRTEIVNCKVSQFTYLH